MPEIRQKQQPKIVKFLYIYIIIVTLLNTIYASWIFFAPKINQMLSPKYKIETVKEFKKYNQNSERKAIYPEIINVKKTNNKFLNNTIKETVIKMIESECEEGNIARLDSFIGIANGDFLSIRFDAMNFGYGAAHPQQTIECLNFNVRKSKMVELEDILIWDDVSINKLDDIIKKLLNNNYPQNDYISINKHRPQFFLQEGGLSLIWDVFQIGTPSADGTPEIFIHWDQIEIFSKIHPLSQQMQIPQELTLAQRSQASVTTRLEPEEEMPPPPPPPLPPDPADSNSVSGSRDQSPTGIASTPDSSQMFIEFSQIRVKLKPPPPPYPPLAKMSKIQGTVVVEITVNPDGVPLRALAVEGPIQLRPTAEAYAMNWRFEPAMLNGEPQVARFRLTIPFRLR